MRKSTEKDNGVLNLEIPCAYQGGKKSIATQVVNMLLSDVVNRDEYVFFDICCGTGAITLELLNRGVKPSQIFMVDNGEWGKFWQSISKGTFDLAYFKNFVENMPDKEDIHDYLQTLSDNPVNPSTEVYDYLVLQAGAFGGKQIWVEDGLWKNNTFRNYWMPTETSSRRSPVNPMMPMPDTLYDRVETIVNYAKGINAACCDAFDVIKTINDMSKVAKVIVYIDPPYQNTEKYHNDLDYATLIANLHNCKVVLSEAKPMVDCDKSEMVITRNPKKGNISGNTTKNNRAEWLNIYNK